VQSTATGELLAKLATAPKLDQQRFLLEGEVGQGGMGAVLRIHDRFLNRRLAMKVLLERAEPRDEEERRLVNQLLGRFLEEAQVTSQLDHPGVVPVHELGLDQNGKVFFTMRLVKGRTAGEVFAESFAGSDDWPLTRALEVVLKVCDTMAYAHEKGVLHRDLKPSNVMVGRFGEVYVMDWGLAKVLGEPDRHDLRIAKDPGTGASKLDTARQRDAADEQSSVVSMDGQQLGTPSYMPPEQARSEELDQRADVYAIGAMLYELLTGRAPYTTPGVRKPAYRILEDVVEGPPKRIEEIRKGVPAELVAISDKAMARERVARYPTVTALATDVRAFLAQRTVQAYRTGALVEMKLWVRRNKSLARTIVYGGLTLLLVLLVALFSILQNAHMSRMMVSEMQRALWLSRIVSIDSLLAREPELSPGWPAQTTSIDAWISLARGLMEAQNELAALCAEIGAKGTATPLVGALGELQRKLPRVEALLPEMEKRARWANCIGRLTLAHPNARHTWAEARAAIANADGLVASELYRGQDIPLRDDDVWGLVPIGMNPQSKLWEFYDLRSAWDGVQDPATLEIPVHEADGRLTITGETGIVFVLLPGGALPVGTPAAGPDEQTRLSVRLDPFFLGKYEVTQGQWQRWTGRNPSYSRAGEDLALPVEQVSWLDVDPVLQAQGLVLPSELQWEYGMRAGTTTRWWTGDDPTAVFPNENVGSRVGLLPVGRMQPNAFGLFDTLGNLSEWCLDEFGPHGTERAGDGKRPERPDGVVLRSTRGGSYGSDPGSPEFANRTACAPSVIRPILGLRAARRTRR
jgi:serine/threonine protein kinase/formylglycine-generating enzyme required for sulfatase activity